MAVPRANATDRVPARRRRAAATALLCTVALVVVGGAAPAGACSCFWSDDDAERAATEAAWIGHSDVAFVGHVVGGPTEIEDDDWPTSAWKVRVDEAVRGTPDEVMMVLTDGPESTCANTLPAGEPIGFYGRRDGEGRIRVGGCGYGRATPEELRSLDLTVPRATSRAPIRFVAAAEQGEASFATFDADGALTGWVFGPSEDARLLPCPGGHTVLAFDDGTPALTTIDLGSLRITARQLLPPDDDGGDLAAQPLWRAVTDAVCLDADGRTAAMLVAREGWHDGLGPNVLRSFADGSSRDVAAPGLRAIAAGDAGALWGVTDAGRGTQRIGRLTVGERVEVTDGVPVPDGESAIAFAWTPSGDAGVLLADLAAPRPFHLRAFDGERFGPRSEPLALGDLEVDIVSVRSRTSVRPAGDRSVVVGTMSNSTVVGLDGEIVEVHSSRLPGTGRFSYQTAADDHIWLLDRGGVRRPDGDAVAGLLLHELGVHDLVAVTGPAADVDAAALVRSPHPPDWVPPATVGARPAEVGISSMPWLVGIVTFGALALVALAVQARRGRRGARA